MTYDVLVTEDAGRYRATVLGLPNCTVEAPTRQQAIRRARDAAVTFFSEGKLVKIEIQSSRQTRSLRDFAGMWADDETFDEFVEAMDSYRQEGGKDEPEP